MSQNRGIVVFSGGSAANNLVDVFENVRSNKECLLNYIIPISDNGGSSSELIRVFGGPGIGDVRSRLIRLIPTEPPSSERSAIRDLFNHRLSDVSSEEATREWYEIVDGTSPIWQGIPSAKKELIRAFFNSLNLEILKRSRPPTSTFDFTSAAVGNLFLTGARLFSGSFESAIYLFGSMCGIPDDRVRVIPAINSNFSYHISAGLENGEVIVGQNSISHPSEPSATDVTVKEHHQKRLSVGDHDTEDANLPGTLPTLRNKNIKFSKSQEEDLPSRIERIWYINPYGQEIHPPANPRVIEAIKSSQAIIYSIGSLYTSIIPSLLLRGVGSAIRDSPARYKILILNGSLDRETGPSSNPYTAIDFIHAITKACEESRRSNEPPSSSSSSPPLPSPTPSLPSPHKSYITHLIHLSPTSPSSPPVPPSDLLLNDYSIETIRLYGRRNSKITTDDATKVGATTTTTPAAYDPAALTGAIESVLGKGARRKTERRNTLEA